MSDRAKTLAYFRYFLSCSWLCLTRTRKAKDVENDKTASFIKDISVGGILI